jgi:hypothetical protein
MHWLGKHRAPDNCLPKTTGCGALFLRSPRRELAINRAWLDIARLKIHDRSAGSPPELRVDANSANTFCCTTTTSLRTLSEWTPRSQKAINGTWLCMTGTFFCEGIAGLATECMHDFYSSSALLLSSCAGFGALAVWGPLPQLAVLRAVL